MALTRPAGCFLQLLSIPALLGGLVLIANGSSSALTGVTVLALGAAMLYYGGRPAREAVAARRRASGNRDSDR